MSTELVQIDLVFMRRAIRLAMGGRGGVEPNPMVGCVIVKEARVIGEGYHQQFGGPHAEPNALAACIESPAGATAYVTLEPCCHLDKKTPPCVPRLIEAKLSRVVIGTLDPNPQVAGRGMQQLREAGIRTDVLDLDSAQQLIAPFAAGMAHHRPYVTLKWAQTSNRKIAGPMGQRIQITAEPATRAVHELRARCDAILVGINTVLNDDPLLTARLATPMRPMTRIVLDASLRIPIGSRLIQSARDSRLIVYTSDASRHSLAATHLESLGVEVHESPLEGPGILSLKGIIADIGKLGVTHLLVEPGPTLAGSFLTGHSSLWDRAWVFQSDRIIEDGIDAPPLPNRLVAQMTIGSDRLCEFLNPLSPVTFSSDPSPDFCLVEARAQMPATTTQANSTRK